MNQGFEAVLLREASTTTLVLRGELDIAAAGAADEAVDMALDDRADAYVLDLTDLRYLSAAGTAPLVRLAVSARRVGAKVTARRAGRLPAVVLSMTPVELEDAPIALGTHPARPAA